MAPKKKGTATTVRSTATRPRDAMFSPTGDGWDIVAPRPPPGSPGPHQGGRDEASVPARPAAANTNAGGRHAAAGRRRRAPDDATVSDVTDPTPSDGEPVRRPDRARSRAPTTRSGASWPTPSCSRCCPRSAYTTGDTSLLRAELRPDPLLLALPGRRVHGRAAVGRTRACARDVWSRFRDGGCVPAPTPTDADVLRIMGHAVGGLRRRLLPPAARGGAGAPRRGPPRARRGARTRSRPTPTSASSSSAPACRACSPATASPRRASTS